MYAESRYTPPKSRAVSLGAAFAINGLILAGLIFSAPEFVKKKIPPVFEAGTYFDPPPPPPIEPPKPQPRTDAPKATAPLPNLPNPLVKTLTENHIEGTTTIYPPQPPLEPAKADPGPIAQPEPLKAAPPLIGAARDARYAEDFQPAYPSSELRAQRDGSVKVRVLIGTNGRVKAVEQVDATSQAFFEATRRQALARWRFKPASRGGVAEESWMTLSVRFELKNQ
ncbi:energy transducer TonB [Sphingomonas sp. MMS12-HWE2-04]|uniref:energy transducer TonB n=1 Tax=Sphingomonas sp. MMS12-HWE2-04 TaxID=3234199 RepID=UPI00384BAC3C